MDQLHRLLNDFEPHQVVDSGRQMDDMLLEIAENLVLHQAGLATAIVTFQSTEDLEDYKVLRRDLLDRDLISWEELRIDAITLLRASR